MSKIKETDNDEKMSRPLTFRLPIKLARTYELQAEKRGVSIHRHLRDVLLSKNKRVTFIKEDDKVNRLATTLWGQIFITANKSTNNIRQIAKHLNALYASSELTTEQYDEYHDLLEIINAQFEFSYKQYAQDLGILKRKKK